MISPDRSRAHIIDRAVAIASLEGLDALTVGRLANDTGMSKSGVFGRFGSKVELQLATLEAARAVFLKHVVEPTNRIGAGPRKARAVIDAYLDYLEDDVFPGGCFLLAAASEWSNRAGPMRDAVLKTMHELREFLATALHEAVPAADPDQLVFEVHAVIAQANLDYQLWGDPQVFARARQMLNKVLAS